jgi:FeS assembly protein IscX
VKITDQGGGNMKWTDTLDIALELIDAHPDVDPQYIRFTDLHKWVCALPGFNDDPEKSNEKILEAIQMTWIEEQD